MYRNKIFHMIKYLIKREWINRFKVLNYKRIERFGFEYIETFIIHNYYEYLSPNKYYLKMLRIHIDL